MTSYSTFLAIKAVLYLRAWTEIPLRVTWRRSVIALSSGSQKTERQAAFAWWRGDALAATACWRELEREQPGRAIWPLKIHQAATESGDFAAAERILLDARGRGIDDEEVEVGLLRCVRMARRSNSAIDDAEKIVTDPAASLNKVFQAGFYLMARNRLEGARAGLGRLLGHAKLGPLVQGYLAAIDLLAEGRAKGRPDIPAWVSPAESSILVREPGSDTLVVGFVLPSGTLGLPLNAAHAMLSSTGVNALYLYDSRQVFHLAGADRFGPGYQAMLDGIRALAAELGTRRLIMLGGSATGYTAIRSALDLNADGALAFSPLTVMLPTVGDGLARNAYSLQRLVRYARPMMADLRPMIGAKQPGPRIEIHYSALSRRDRMHAANVAGLRDVRLHPVSGLARHDCLTELARRGCRDLLDAFPAR
ncbi:MAG TPA: hypothetical protein VGB91_13745 [Rhizomicrobium sp.]